MLELECMDKNCKKKYTEKPYDNPQELFLKAGPCKLCGSDWIMWTNYERCINDQNHN